MGFRSLYTKNEEKPAFLSRSLSVSNPIAISEGVWASAPVVINRPPSS